jgi:hypothetical protein
MAAPRVGTKTPLERILESHHIKRHRRRVPAVAFAKGGDERSVLEVSLVRLHCHHTSPWPPTALSNVTLCL